jgi:hypothetical protein
VLYCPKGAGRTLQVVTTHEELDDALFQMLSRMLGWLRLQPTFFLGQSYVLRSSGCRDSRCFGRAAFTRCQSLFQMPGNWVHHSCSPLQTALFCLLVCLSVRPVSRRGGEVAENFLKLIWHSAEHESLAHVPEIFGYLAVVNCVLSS